MSQRSGWRELRTRRRAEPGAAEAYDAARLAFALGVRLTVQLDPSSSVA